MILRRAAVLAVAASTLTLVPVSTAGAQPPTSASLSAFDRQLIADVNDARIQRGIPPLNLSRRLTPIATRWSEQIASDDNPRDNPDLRSELDAACPAWRKLGENVGVAGEATADDLFRVHMHNTGERRTMLNRKFTWVGVHSAETDDNGSSEVFSVMDFANHCS